MSRDANVAAQEHLAELVNGGKLDALDDVFAPDVVDHDPAPRGPDPRSGTRPGLASAV